MILRLISFTVQKKMSTECMMLKEHGRETDFSMYRYFLKMSKLSWDSMYLCHIFTSFFSQIILRHYNTMYMYQRNHIYTRILFYALYSLTVNDLYIEKNSACFYFMKIYYPMKVLNRIVL